MKIAVCDDDPIIRDVFSEMVDNILGGNYCSAYADVDDMILEIEAGVEFDIVFLDIEWNGKERGISFAEEINKICPSTDIVFLTGYTERYVERAFLCTFRFSGFLVKPVREEILRKYLEKIAEENIKKNQDKFVIKVGGVSTALLFHEIIYLESFGHRIKIAMYSGKIYHCYDKLEKLAAVFPESFVKCHQSYIVNMQHVDCLKAGERLFVMKSGLNIPISKARYHDTKEKFRAYRSSDPIVWGFS